MAIPDDPTGRRPIKTAQDRPPLRLASSDDRAEVLLTADVHLATDAMVAALRADDALYQRSGILVHVVHPDMPEEGRAPGTPVVRECPLSWLLDRVSTYVRCLKQGKKGAKHVDPPPQRVRAVLERGQWAGLRHLENVIESPSMRPDGTLIQDAGYDAATRSLYAPNVHYPLVDDAPSQSDAVVAYARLAEVFCDFPYVNESHRSAAIAAILTLVARPAIVGAVPCWLFDASARRSGKSLQVDAISLIATGRPAGRMTFPPDEEELEKVMASYAMAGDRIVPFDNVNRAFGGAALDKCITAIDTVDLRILGRTQKLTLPWRAVVIASGNNAYAKDDMLPRVLSPRIETPLENPETRTDLRHHPLLPWVAARRAELATAALTILRGYVAAGRPQQDGCGRWGGFDAWAALIPQSLVWVGAADPMGARRGLAGDEDPTAQAERALVAGWELICRTHVVEDMSVSVAIGHIYPPPRKDEPPDGFDGLREALELLTNARPGIAPSSARVGYALRAVRQRPIMGKRMVIAGESGGTRRWRVEAMT